MGNPSRQTISTISAASSVAAACSAVLRLVDRCEALGVLYADPVCGPYSDLTFALLLRRLNIRWEYCALDGLCEIVWPAICGTHLVQLERAQTPAEKRFALRHATGHVLAEDCAGLTRAHDGHDWRSREETVADGFALIDLISDVAIRDRLHAGWSWGEMREWVEVQVRTHGPTWAEDRVMHRLEGRLWLFAERESGRQERRR